MSRFVWYNRWLWFNGYKDKFFVLLSIATPFVQLIDALFEIILLPTPFRSCINETFLKKLIHTQMKKRKEEFLKTQHK